MIKKHILLIFLAFLIAMPALVVAGHRYYHGSHGCPAGGWDMTAMDADGDGVLTFEEYTASMVEKKRLGFEMIDTNGDGKISVDEWETLLKVHGMDNG